MSVKKFALIGVAGFIAPRHLQAIKDTQNDLLAALDKFDSVGILDSYFPATHFFTEFERFDRHLDKLKRVNKQIDYLSICTPNYLHDAHIRFALRMGADAICEKPIVLNPWNIKALLEIEKETGRKVHNILQLRLHPEIIELRKKILNSPSDKIYDIDLTYITSRGNWYSSSWKGDISKSGGIATNIGIHFFDMLTWIFGGVESNQVNVSCADYAAGVLSLKKARIRWFLSINFNHLPKSQKENGKRTFRSLKIDGDEIEFSEGFTDLHTRSYQEILAGRGFGLGECMSSIEIVSEIRNSVPKGLKDEYHPLLKNLE